MPTEGLPGAPTVTLLKVSTAGTGAAVDAAGPTSASAITRPSAGSRRFCRAAETARRVRIVSHRRSGGMLEAGGIRGGRLEAKDPSALNERKERDDDHPRRHRRPDHRRQ